jgi:outer membrane lipoprotein-sorting protein
MNKNVLISVVCFLTAFLTSTQALAITAEELADICEAMENGIQDIYMEFEWGLDPPADINEIINEMGEKGFLVTKGPQKFTWATKRPFGQFSLSTQEATLVNRYGESQNLTMKQSYNGRIAKHFQKSSSQRRQDSLTGTITRRGNLVHSMQLTPAAFSILSFSISKGTDRTPLSKLLRDKERISLDDNIVKINGFNAIKVDILTKQTKVLWRGVYFSVEHGYAPVAIEYGRGGGKWAIRYNVTSFEKISDGLWFPKSGYMESPDDDSRTVFTASTVSLNQGLGDEFFDFEFPPGTKISDEISDLVYIFKPTEEEFNTWLEDEERLALHEARQEGKMPVETNHEAKQEGVDDTVISSASDTLRKSVNSQQQANVQKPKITVLIYGSIVLVAAILIILAVRRYHSHRAVCS